MIGAAAAGKANNHRVDNVSDRLRNETVAAEAACEEKKCTVQRNERATEFIHLSKQAESECPSVPSPK